MSVGTNTYPLIQLLNANTTTTGQYSKKTTIIKGFVVMGNQVFEPRKSHSIKNPIKVNLAKLNGYVIEILFHGFNFTAKRIKLFRKKYQLDTHKSEIFIFNESINTPFKSKIYKRRIIVFSYETNLLNMIKNSIKELKLPDTYTGKGLFERNDIYKVKKVRKTRR